MHILVPKQKIYELNKKRKKRKSLKLKSHLRSLKTQHQGIITTSQRLHPPAYLGLGDERFYIYPLLFTQAGSPTCLNTSLLLFAWLNSVFGWFSPRLPLFSPLASLSEPRSATPFFTQQTAGNTVCRTRLRWICFSSFSLENRVLFLNRPRSISLLSSSSSCLVIESLPLSDAISLRIKGLYERRGNTLYSLIWIQETA